MNVKILVKYIATFSALITAVILKLSLHSASLMHNGAFCWWIKA